MEAIRGKLLAVSKNYFLVGCPKIFGISIKQPPCVFDYNTTNSVV
jgi:hypothetical protein